MESVSTIISAPDHFPSANPALLKYSGGNGKSVSFSLGNQKRAWLSVRRLLFWETIESDQVVGHGRRKKWGSAVVRGRGLQVLEA